jgi:hypothetical protein
MSPTTGVACVTEDMKMCKACLTGLSFPLPLVYSFLWGWRSESRWGSGGEGRSHIHSVLGRELLILPP